VTNINGLIFLVNVNFGLKLQFIEKMFFFTTNASKNKSMWRTKLEHFFGTNMDFKFYREQKPRCEQVRMDSNILKKDHWRTGYLYILKVSLSKYLDNFRENNLSVLWMESGCLLPQVTVLTLKQEWWTNWNGLACRLAVTGSIWH
jgi:hypothetical protein